MVRIEDRALYNVDRKEAADFLQISSRTLDRYVRSGRISYKKVGHHVYLSINELEEFKKQLGEEVGAVDIVERSSESPVEERQVEVRQESAFAGFGDMENQIYRSLYEETKQELNKKQKEVEILNYRLGKMEYELKNTIPLLEYNEERGDLEEENKLLQARVEHTEKNLVDSVQALRAERKVKFIYLAAIVLLVLVSSVTLLIRFGAVGA